MNTRALCVLAGPAALSIASVAAGSVYIDYIHTTGADDPFLAANSLQSVLFQVHGVPAGHDIIGLLGTAGHSWTVAVSSGSFFNTAGGSGYGGDSIHSAKPVAGTFDPDGTIGMAWDSGFVAPDEWNLHAGGIGETAFGLSGGNEVGAAGSLIAGAPYMFPGGPIDLFQITFDSSAVATVQFVFMLAEGVNGGPAEIAFAYTIPAPGALGLIGLAGLVVTSRRRRA